jgi:ribose-phosphate pyrophosphokinase
MSPVIFALPGNEAITGALATQLGAELGTSEVRRFPDGDSYVRLDTPVAGRAVILVCTLDRPDEKFLPLSFMATTARELGADRVGLVSPYLAYMRQDKRFRSGEAVSSVHFAKLLSESIDWLITVDPHLHRHHSLTEIFSVPAVAVHAAPRLASWVRQNVLEPVLIGPDSESEQWVASGASGVGASYIVLDKVRNGDRDVAVSTPDLGGNHGRTPVLVDDIISTSRTMVATMGQLARIGSRSAVCVGVHAIFAGNAYANLRAAGAGKIVTCNTIPHESNAIDVSADITAAVRQLLSNARPT